MLTLYDIFYISLFALLTMLGEKKWRKLFFDSVSIVIRVISKVDGVRFITFLAKTVLIPNVSTTAVNHP